ncbi:hypothetical protein GCM10010112_22420 [Actinoplanes lobatus]|uniref:DUF3817 domain-containing protein n=1 Tax=Actinoplanes lobatus TaxID=113568 RepID=A0A7W7HIR1_9ACTN|nr:DUF3817 domain-containing protein [Actinoplanes lobatus]MBB4751285.1 hypothetical protein [Actinoplanes lobatus]GGN63291.1 hypothetical protein GCM10010112_22420 [Actinoplanes lobatus]GIE44773.1 hypothetical protein Alo02nite_76710 [Actinoplanes lobatus]
MPLRIAAAAELATLLVLFANLATVHWPPVSSAIGPLHGCAYLFVIVLAVRETRSTGTRLAALIPGIGGLLVLRRLAAERRHGRAT